MTPAQRQLVLPSFARLLPFTGTLRQLFAVTPALRETSAGCDHALAGKMKAGAGERRGELLPSEALRVPGLY